MIKLYHLSVIDNDKTKKSSKKSKDENLKLKQKKNLSYQ